eukprot:COSAG02_NODE_6704_length_3411_cov_1.610507_2_plen_531_part_00
MRPGMMDLYMGVGKDRDGYPKYEHVSHICPLAPSTDGSAPVAHNKPAARLSEDGFKWPTQLVIEDYIKNAPGRIAATNNALVDAAPAGERRFVFTVTTSCDDLTCRPRPGKKPCKKALAGLRDFLVKPSADYPSRGARLRDVDHADGMPAQVELLPPLPSEPTGDIRMLLTYRGESIRKQQQVAAAAAKKKEEEEAAAAKKKEEEEAAAAKKKAEDEAAAAKRAAKAEVAKKAKVQKAKAQRLELEKVAADQRAAALKAQEDAAAKLKQEMQLQMKKQQERMQKQQEEHERKLLQAQQAQQEHLQKQQEEHERKLLQAQQEAEATKAAARAAARAAADAAAAAAAELQQQQQRVTSGQPSSPCGEVESSTPITPQADAADLAAGGNNQLDTFAQNHNQGVLPALAELVHNAADARAETLKIDYEDEKGGRIVFKDNGIGMTHEECNNMLMFGRNGGRENTIGKFGVGFKSGSIRCAQTAVVISRSKKKRTTSYGLLSNVPYEEEGGKRYIRKLVTVDHELEPTAGVMHDD